MPFHAAVQRLLLVGISFPKPTVVGAAPPSVIRPLVDAVIPLQAQWNERAIELGHRYRSAYWAIYLLSAVAVLTAVLPLALGWDDHDHPYHAYAGIWSAAELCVILAVGVIFWLGYRRDWQGGWLAARTQAELAWYLPLVAILLDFEAPVLPGDWYRAALSSEVPSDETPIVESLCRRVEGVARDALSGAWRDPRFVPEVITWASGIVAGQIEYHERVAVRNHALLHRVHQLTLIFFALTAVGAALHLVVHSPWLVVATTFFPALGASLHGALAQSEAYRLSTTSERLVLELKEAQARLERAAQALPDQMIAAVRGAVREVLEIILDEHRDWHMLIKPHRLPLG